jgi:hypothetical protein
MATGWIERCAMMNLQCNRAVEQRVLYSIRTHEAALFADPHAKNAWYNGDN